MTPLRQRFIEDMNLAGLAPGTQATYISTVRKLARHYGQTPPQNLTEKQVEDYIRQLQKTAARGTFQAEFGALRFLFCNTLLREWAIFTKKKSVAPSASGCPSPSPTTIAVR